MAVTIYDVAKRAGVGIGTVSRVLNDSPRVSEATRQKVLAAIEELDYRPSSIAQRLSLRRTFTIGVITPFFTRPAFVGRLRGVEAALTESEYDLVLYNVETTDKRDACFRELPISQRFDGLLLIALPPTDEDVALFQQASIPVVLVDAHHPALSYVVIDDVRGGYMATKHLIELGHTRIAYISDPLESPFRFTSSLHRYQGYRQALDEAAIVFRSEYHRWAEHGEEQARDMARHLLSLAEPPTAIFAASDTQAIGAMEAIRERGLHIPRDVALVGYDDIEASRYLGLTTIHQPFFESGLKGVELLIQAIDHPLDGPLRIELPVELICRRSTTGDVAPPEDR
jgi:LacI family transcriptional regulator